MLGSGVTFFVIRIPLGPLGPLGSRPCLAIWFGLKIYKESSDLWCCMMAAFSVVSGMCACYVPPRC